MVISFAMQNGCMNLPESYALCPLLVLFVSNYISPICHNFSVCTAIAQSVQRLATGWTVRGSNPGGGEIFRTRPDRPWGPLLYNGYRVFPGGKAAGAWRWPRTSIQRRGLHTAYTLRSPQETGSPQVKPFPTGSLPSSQDLHCPVLIQFKSLRTPSLLVSGVFILWWSYVADIIASVNDE